MADDVACAGVPLRTRLWWRVVLVVMAVLVVAFAAGRFDMARLRIGLMGATVEPRQPAVYRARLLVTLVDSW